MRNVIFIASTICVYQIAFAHGPDCMCLNCEQNRLNAREEGFAEGFHAAKRQATKPNARYPLLQGIDVAIDNVVTKQRPLSVKNVIHELEEMQKANDVRLPYSYNSKTKISSTGKNTTKTWMSEDQKQKYAEFQKTVSLKIEQFLAKLKNSNQNNGIVVIIDPSPDQYQTKESYITAYVNFKLEHIDETTKSSYMKKLGGINTYKREMKAKAEKLWNAEKSR